MFGRHSSTSTAPSDTIVDDRADSTLTDAAPTDAAPAEANSGVAVDSDPNLVDESTAEVREDQAERKGAEEQAAADNTQRISTRPPVVTEPVVTEPEREPAVVAEPVRTGWAHVSMIATLSLIIGTLAIAATLTGLLAPLGFGGGILAVLLGLIALVAVRRPNVTGHGLMVFGIVFGLIAIVLSMLAMGGQLSWLSNKTDEVATVHAWLNNHFHWLRRW